MILWLASYPRSGNTFLRIILRDCFGMETYSDSNDTRDIGANKELSAIVGHRRYDGSWEEFYHHARQSQDVIPIKTHDGPRDGQKAIYVMRDPHAASVSYFHYYEQFGRMPMSMEDIIIGATPAGAWSDHVGKWRPLDRPNTLLLRFEDMKASPSTAIEMIGAFIGMAPVKTEASTFAELSHAKPEFFRTGSNATNIGELTEAQKGLISFINADAMAEYSYTPLEMPVASQSARSFKEYSTHVLEQKRQMLAMSDRLEKARQQVRESQKILNRVREDLEISRSTQLVERKAFIAEKESQRLKYEVELAAQRDELNAIAAEKEHLAKRSAVAERALAPSLSAMVSLRAVRFAFAEWRLIKAGGEHWRPLTPAAPSRHGASSPTVQPSSAADMIAAVKAKTAERQLSTSACDIKDMGVAVFGYDRAESLVQVLHSLTLQGAAPFTHVFIDGDQGRPAKRAEIDLVHECARQFPVKAIHRNRGNYGFRKMMLLSMKTMMDRYDKLLFLEDDCFPVGGAVETFSRELDVAAKQPDICSVYGHHFLVPGEENGLARFQGWGWATTSAKLRPVWEELMNLYLMPEEEYLAFVGRELTPEIARRIDVTPGRQPTDTIRKFFAWDEALCLVTALRGMRHQASSRRLVYNFGAGGKSSHFHAVDFYRRPPFNMVSADEIWDYY